MNWANVLLDIVVIALVAGLFNWAIQSMPFIEPSVKQMLRVLIVVVTVLAVIAAVLGHGPHWVSIH